MQLLRKITPEDFVTTTWSGGETRQLAIGPEGAVYGQRDFLWRVSSATVEVVKSDFTLLKDYNRYLATIEGSIKLQHGTEAEFTLEPGMVDYFDGGIPTSSKGFCRDFNLMVRKDKCQGNMYCLQLPKGSKVNLPVSRESGDKTMVVYCTAGTAMFKLGEQAATIEGGEALLFTAPELAVVHCDQASCFMVAEIIIP